MLYPIISAVAFEGSPQNWHNPRGFNRAFRALGFGAVKAWDRIVDEV